MIDPLLLYKYGATRQRVEKGDLIFTEGTKPFYYFQILDGKVKMFNSAEDGREYIQGYFSDGDSFGEPPLFYDGLYPAHCVADSDATLIRLKKETLMQLLRENIDELFKITTTFAVRLKDKSVRSVELALHEPKHRITTLLAEFKKRDYGTCSNERWLVPFTRQQIADMTGLRVETVIRIVKEMEKQGLLEIRDRKIYF